MTPLPERRKTAEELAELRENLGVPDELPPGAPGAGSVDRERAELPQPRESALTPSPADRAAAEPAPDAGDDGEGGEVSGIEVAEPDGDSEPRSDPSGVRRPKPVRSLRRSEREPPKDPPPKRAPRPDSKLPVHRRGDGELQRIRMQNAMQAKPPVERIAAQAAHPMMLILGYALAVAGGVGGLLVALLLFLKKPRSSHHAAWMTIIGVLVMVFGILYLLPKTDGP